MDTAILVISAFLLITLAAFSVAAGIGIGLWLRRPKRDGDPTDDEAYGNGSGIPKIPVGKTHNVPEYPESIPLSDARFSTKPGETISVAVRSGVRDGNTGRFTK